MVKNVCKVENISDNIFNFDISNKLKNALILKYVNPCVSIFFLKDVLSLEDGNRLGKMAGINFNKDNCTLEDGTVICDDYIEYVIINDMLLCAKNALEKDTDNKYFVVNIVKDEVGNKVKSDVKLSVEDLMAKLYSNKEEKGKSL